MTISFQNFASLIATIFSSATRLRVRAVFGVVLGLLFLALCAGSSAVGQTPGLLNRDPSASRIDPVPIRLVAGDMIDLTVFDTPELSAAKLRVEQDGSINAPVVGTLNVAGLTPAEASRAVEAKLRDGHIMQDARVTIFVSEYASGGISVLGEVNKPGQYVLLGSPTLYAALAAASGTTDKQGSIITITRRNDPANPLTLNVNSPNYSRLQAETLLQSGDLVVVSRAKAIYVVGDVGHPGEFLLSNGTPLNVLRAIALAQGTNQTAAAKKASIVRDTRAGVETIHIDLDRVAKNEQPDPTLEPGDIVVVPRSGGRAFMQYAMPAAAGSAAGAVCGCAHLPLMSYLPRLPLSVELYLPSIRFKPDAVLRMLALVVATVLLLHLMVRGEIDLLITLAITSSLLLIALVDRAMAALLTFVYLILMGDVRRLVSFISAPTSFDLLLLVGPLLASILALPLLLHVRLREKLSMAMMVLIVVMTLELVNPSQGGLAIGLSGALFYLAPMFWFWVGRRYGSPRIVDNLIYRVLLPLSIFAALLGLVQSTIGFLPWEQAWIDRSASTYLSLHLGNSIRSFGFSVSSAEYTTLLTIGAAAAVAASFAGDRRWLWALPVLLVSVILASTRGPVLKLTVAIACIWVLRHGRRPSFTKIVRFFVLAGIGIACLGFIASKALPGEAGNEQAHSAVQDALAHQAGGFAHPLDERYSTAGLHGSMVMTALWDGVTHPIGRGLGATTLAVSKFGNSNALASSEVDLSDMFVCLGLIGGLTYTFAVFAALQQSLQYLLQVPRHTSLAVIGILICTLGSWLISGQYSTASILFFVIGGLVYEPFQEIGSPRHA